MPCQSLNAGILTSRKRTIKTRRKTSIKPFLVLAMLLLSFVGGWRSHKPETIIITKIETRYEKTPAFLPLPKTRNLKRQIDTLAAAIPEKLLQPMGK